MYIAVLIFSIIGSLSALVSAIFAFKANKTAKKIHSKINYQNVATNNCGNNDGFIIGTNSGKINNGK